MAKYASGLGIVADFSFAVASSVLSALVHMNLQTRCSPFWVNEYHEPGIDRAIEHASILENLGLNFSWLSIMHLH